MTLSENDLWLLSFYRSSEISAALFFGHVSRFIRGPLQKDVTHHFSDEANHSRLWTDCITELGHRPIKLHRAYQDKYLDAVGLPANVMEVMAATNVLEKRVIGHYRQHLRIPNLNPVVKATIEKIMLDERWHVQYVRDELQRLAGKYGEEEVARTVQRYTEADRAIYAEGLAEYAERFALLPTDGADEPADIEFSALAAGKQESH